MTRESWALWFEFTFPQNHHNDQLNKAPAELCRHFSSSFLHERIKACTCSITTAEIETLWLALTCLYRLLENWNWSHSVCSSIWARLCCLWTFVKHINGTYFVSISIYTLKVRSVYKKVRCRVVQYGGNCWGYWAGKNQEHWLFLSIIYIRHKKASSQHIKFKWDKTVQRQSSAGYEWTFRFLILNLAYLNHGGSGSENAHMSHFWQSNDFSIEATKSCLPLCFVIYVTLPQSVNHWNPSSP